jgi:hypothetical protein
VKGNAYNSTCILATSGLDAQAQGPFAHGEEAARIKLPIVQDAAFLFVLASGSKLTKTANEMFARDHHLYREMAYAWEQRLKRPETLWVVSDLDEKVTPLVDAEAGHPEEAALSAALQTQLKNARFLRNALRSQFIIAPPADTLS